MCRTVAFFNEVGLHPHNSYYFRNTIKSIRRASSVIDQLLPYIYTRCNVITLATVRSCVYMARARTTVFKTTRNINCTITMPFNRAKVNKDLVRKTWYRVPLITLPKKDPQSPWSYWSNWPALIDNGSPFYRCQG